MNINRVIFGVILFSISVILNAQVGGISASKLATINADVVGNKNIEFEPSFGMSWAKSYYDDDGNLHDHTNIFFEEQIIAESEMGFRFSYGLMDIIEVGFSLPVNADAISLGAKYNFMNKELVSLSAIAGYNKIIMNRTLDARLGYDESDFIAGGLVSTFNFSEQFSLDFDAQFQKTTQETVEVHELDIFFNADVGYYVFNWLQPVVGFNYGKSYFSVPEPSPYPSHISEGILNVGFTIEPAEQYLMVINMPYTLAGKAVDKITGFGFALTITLE